MKRSSPVFLVASVLLLIFFGQAAFGSVRLSLTTDEPMHIAMGYTSVAVGDYRLLPVHIHPPLTNMWAAWPLLLRPDRPDPREVEGWADGNLFKFSARLIEQLGPVEAVEFATRVPIMLLSLLLGALVFRWASDLGGAWAGALALLLYVFDPGILASSQFNTTDMGAAAFGVLATFVAWRAARRPTRGRLVLIGVALGAAMASKVSGLFFVPMQAALFGLTLLKAHWGRWGELGRHSLQWAARLALIYALALGVVWAAYRFEVGRLPGWSLPVPAPSHWLVLQAFNRHIAEGHYAFLAGQVSQHGWWWYFMLAFVIKTPIPTLLLLAVSVVVRIRQRGPAWLDDAWLLAIPVVYFINAVFSTIDIGYRHLLPLFPFLFVFVAYGISHIAYRSSPSTEHALHPNTIRLTHHVRMLFGLLIASFVLLTWYILGTVLIFPDYIAYFNELVGGPDGGYRYLVDSNTDWGQTIKALKRYVDAQGLSKLNLSFFTFIDPAIYGLSYQPIAPMTGAPAVLPARFNPPSGVYAISTTTLQGIPLADPEQYDWFRRREPEAKIGHAMFVYRVQASQPRAWVAQCTSPVSPLDPPQILDGLGRSDMRLAYFDCASSWLYPTGGQSPGWVITSRDTPMWNTAWNKSVRLSYEQTRAGFAPPFRVYEDDGRVTWPSGGSVRLAPSTVPLAEALKTPSVDLPIVFENGLTLIGYALERSTAKPGETVYLETVWRVDRVPGRLLSIMAQALSDGGALAVGDGLGVPIESWQPGDVIVQRHALVVPKASPRGAYWLQTGVYWIDDGMRWQAQDARASGDRVLLAVLKIQ
jgi:hypothetical protein